MVFILPFGNVRIMTVLVLALITTVVPSPIPQVIPTNQVCFPPHTANFDSDH